MKNLLGTDLKSIVNEIEKHDVIILHRHSFPDGDAIGSQAGMRFLIEENYPGKKVYLTGQNAKIVREKYDGKRVILGIRPEDIYEYEEAKAGGFDQNSVGVEETVVTREMLGAEVVLYFDEQNRTHAVRLQPSNQTKVGEKVKLYFDMDHVHVFDKETEENILYRKGC